MAIGPEEGKSGFAAGRGRPVERRPRGSSMGGVDSKEFVPASVLGVAAEPGQFDDAC